MKKLMGITNFAGTSDFIGTSDIISRNGRNISSSNCGFNTNKTTYRVFLFER